MSFKFGAIHSSGTGPGVAVSQAVVDPCRYVVSIFGSGYRVTYSIAGSKFCDIPGAAGLRDGSQAQRRAKIFHQSTFGPKSWPKKSPWRE